MKIDKAFQIDSIEEKPPDTIILTMKNSEYVRIQEELDKKVSDFPGKETLISYNASLANQIEEAEQRIEKYKQLLRDRDEVWREQLTKHVPTLALSSMAGPVGLAGEAVRYARLGWDKINEGLKADHERAKKDVIFLQDKLGVMACELTASNEEIGKLRKELEEKE